MKKTTGIALSAFSHPLGLLLATACGALLGWLVPSWSAPVALVGRMFMTVMEMAGTPLLMVATALSFQLPVLQLILGALGLIRASTMGAAWRWVLLSAAVASAVITPSTDPLTMLLLAGAIMALYLVGLVLVSLAERLRPAAD